MAVSSAALGEAKQQLDKAAYELMLEECEYDAKCLSAYLANVASYELRVQHQKDTWTKRRVERAKDASNIAWDSKAIGQNQSNIIISVNTHEVNFKIIFWHLMILLHIL